MKLLVIVPAYNEAEIIEDTIDRIRKTIPEADVLVVNDGSTDDTNLVLKNNGADHLNLRINLGIGGAVQSGYKFAMENSYDYAVQIDGDGQHDPVYIRPMISQMKSENADMAVGSRFIEKQGFQSSRARRFGIRFLSWLIYITGGSRVKDVTSGYRIVNRKFIEHFAKDYSDDFPEPDAVLAVLLNGGRVIEYPVIMNERTTGTSSITFRKSVYYMIKVSLSIIMFRLMNRNRR